MQRTANQIAEFVVVVIILTRNVGVSACGVGQIIMRLRRVNCRVRHLENRW